MIFGVYFAGMFAGVVVALWGINLWVRFAIDALLGVSAVGTFIGGFMTALVLDNATTRMRLMRNMMPPGEGQDLSKRERRAILDLMTSIDKTLTALRETAAPSRAIDLRRDPP